MTETSHCRLCAEEKQISDLISVSENCKNLNLKILQCYQIQIELEDRLPKSVCKTCYDEVNQFYDIHEKVQKAQGVLQEIYLKLEDSKTEWENSTPNTEEKNDTLQALVKIEESDNFLDSFNDSLDYDVESNDFIDDIKNEDSDRKYSKESKRLKKSSNIISNKTYKKKVKELWKIYIWRCSDCTFEFKSVKELQNHYKSGHKKPTIYSCMECSKPYLKFDLFRRHINIHLNKHKFRCESCDKYFSNKWDLQVHSRKHSDVRKFSCDICGKKFKSKGNLKNHTRLHTDEEKHECDTCHKKFSSPLGLYNHQQVHLDPNVADAMCEHCGKGFMNKYLLKAHLHNHVIGHPYQCNQCDKSFKWSQGLRYHKKTIHSDSSFTCDICGRKLSSKTTLNKHKLLHTSNFPFQCMHCEKGFRNKYGLQVHLRQHTGEKPYSCYECNHFFANSSNFIKHLKGKHGLTNVSSANRKQYPFEGQ